MMRPAILVPGLIAIYFGLAVIFLLAMPAPHGPFEYLVAGAFATGVCLLIGFGLYAWATLGRNTRKNGRAG